MYRRSGSDQTIHRGQRTAAGLTSRDHTPPFVCDFCGDGKDSRFETERQLLAEPGVQFLAARTRCEPLDTVPEFGECCHAEENAIFVSLLQPGDDAGVGLR